MSDLTERRTTSIACGRMLFHYHLCEEWRKKNPEQAEELKPKLDDKVTDIGLFTFDTENAIDDIVAESVRGIPAEMQGEAAEKEYDQILLEIGKPFSDIIVELYGDASDKNIIEIVSLMFV